MEGEELEIIEPDIPEGDMQYRASFEYVSLIISGKEIKIYPKHLTLWHWTKIFIQYIKPFKERIKKS